MRRCSSVLVLILGGAVALAKEKPPIVHRIPQPPRPDFSELEWLVGEWRGTTTEKSPQGEVSLSIAFDLDKRFMVFREQLSLAPTPTWVGSKEAWLGVLGRDHSNAAFVLRVYSDTGFVSRYRVTVEAGTVSFHPEGGEQPPPGWLFRRTLQRTDVGEMLETVQVAPPRKPFFDYYTAKLTRAIPPAVPPTPPPSKPTPE